jgi:glycosyltransferase involved in cell wall biosynthesis/SAM-dependent methyltransferase
MKSKQEKIALFDGAAADRSHWRKKNHYYYESLERLYRFLVPRGHRVVELGCGTGELLAAVEPSRGVGVDFSGNMLDLAKAKFSDLDIQFIQADAESYVPEDPCDYVLLSDLLGESSDVWTLFRNIRGYCEPKTRVVASYFNPLWEPVLRFGERFGFKMPQDHQNWLAEEDVRNLFELCGFEVVKSGRRLLFPRHVPLLSGFINGIVANLPLVNRLCLINYAVARPIAAGEFSETGKDRGVSRADSGLPGVSVIIPCRNEKGNIRNSIQRVPEMGAFTEIIYVDGNSNDGTVEEIESIMDEFGDQREIRLIHQVPPGSEDGRGHGRMLKLGKGDAVRKGFAAARGDVLMILDADLTVMPEELPRFYEALLSNRAEFVNGTRLVYPMERDAMRTLNRIANKLFALSFSWLLGQRIKDTLCGTKVLLRRDYEEIARGRAYFGEFDPFGDFDLLFGAAKLNLRIMDMPIHYAERVSGDIKIERFRHGLLLIKMCWFAAFKLRFLH